LILGGEVFRGKDNLAGEIGPVAVSDSGVPCACGGRGCLEPFCSGTAIARTAQDWAVRRPDGVGHLLELSGGKIENITAKIVVEAAREGDQPSLNIIAEVSRWLARGILMIIRVVNPNKIILGGGVAQAGQVLLTPIRQALAQLGSPTVGYTTEVTLAELGIYSPLYGAAATALDLVAKGT
jgi:glucokinase